jgi:glycosyltransferase involved in cell wall biosynthesis
MHRGRVVSVIVRTKDRPILLKKALKSIVAQTYRPVEAVIVNDGGQDLDTVEIQEILGDIDLRYVKLDKSAGRAHAGNTGIEHARGEYAAFLDDDDLFYPDHLAILVDVLERYDYQAVYSDAHISYHDFDPDKTQIVEREKRLFTSKDFSYEELLVDNYIPLLCLLFRKETLKKYKGFDENFEIYEDWDLLIRIAEKHPFYHIPRITAEYVQWSRDLQVAQAPVFFDKAAAYHNHLILKHKNKYSSEIIKSLVQSRRLIHNYRHAIEEKELIISEGRSSAENLEKALREKEGHLSGLQREIQERDRSLTELAGKLEELQDLSARLEEDLRIRDARITELEETVGTCNMHTQNTERALQEREARLQELNKIVQDSEAYIADLKNTLDDRDIRLIELKKATLENGSAIARLEEQVRQKNFYIAHMETAKANIERVLRDREAALNRIYDSNGWKGLLLYYRMRDRILPPYTRRRSVIKSAVGRFRKLVKNASPDGLSFRESAACEPPSVVRGASAGNGDSAQSPNDQGCRGNEGRSAFDGMSVRDVNTTSKKAEVLVAGIYLANQENAVGHIVAELKSSKNYTVSQRWIALFGDAPSEEVKAVTISAPEKPEPKFVLLNRILAGEKLHRYDYILFCDDDIRLGQGFLDMFLGLQDKYDFSLAQPARTHNSYIDHPFVEQFDGLKARRTRFIEIGPVVSVRKDAFPVLLPFDESSHMGWGYDFVWPCLMEKMGMRMGIIDATPVDHSMRKPVMNYNYDEANKSMQNYLSRSPHLSKEEAFRILESYV